MHPKQITTMTVHTILSKKGNNHSSALAKVAKQKLNLV